MTLELRLTHITGSKAPQYVYVNGGQSGSLRLSAKKLPQTIKCSKKDHLQFLICGKQSSVFPVQQDAYASRDFWAQSTIDQNRELWNDGNQHQYKIQYFNELHQKVGDLVFQVKYTRGLFYQGQIQGAQRIGKRLLPFYTTRCPTHNLYNCLDHRDGPSTFNFIEDIYRDE